MSIQLTDAQRKLLDDKNLAYIAAVSADGLPQVTPVWIEYDGTHVRFNTAEGRAKMKHLRANSKVAICVSNRENPYQYVEIRGTVVELTHDGADEMINRLAKKYIDQDVYPFRQPGEVRVVVKIDPEKVFGMGL